jgi:hypothetical protein
MPKRRTILTIDEDVLRAVKAKAARTGQGESELIEEAVRKSLGLDLLERLWSGDLSADEAMDLALGAQSEARSPDR